MDTPLSDIALLVLGFGIGATVGAVLTVVVGLKGLSIVARRVRERVAAALVKQGYFYHLGTRYIVSPDIEKGTKH